MPMHKGHVLVPLKDRFWAKVDKRGPDECWPWTSITSKGYGVIYVNPRKRRASQVSWEIANGRPFPDDMHACHTCDNPICVNPAHIFPGTRSDNLSDASRKGRMKHHSRAIWTHCSRGHEFTPEHTIVTKHGHRQCRECKRMHNAKRRKS